MLAAAGGVLEAVSSQCISEENLQTVVTEASESSG